jgi:DNA-binding transcriptional LysR family regulator
MADRLTGIEVFVRAVRLGGLSAAARTLGISSTMAAKHLNDLEQRLGATLLLRTTRRLSLTEAGSTYLERAERILADLHEAEAEVSAQSLIVEGLLRISAPATFGILAVTDLASEFASLHPAVTIELGLDDRYVDLLEERWDVAIRIGRLADSPLKARKLAEVRMCVCASPAYLAARGEPRTVADLQGHDCLGYTPTASVGTTFWGFGPDGEIRAPIKGSLHANDGAALVQAAVAGRGLVYGPRFIAAEPLQAGQLVEVSLDLPLANLGAVYAVTHPNRRPAAKTRAWIDFVISRMPALATHW